MRSHQFDMNQSSLTQDQLKRAMNQVSQLAKGANARLANLKLMSGQARQVIGVKINFLAAHVQKIIQNVDSQAQIKFVIKKFQLQIQQIITSKQLMTVITLVTNRIHQSSLTDHQQTVAINEIKAAGRFAKEDMVKATNHKSIASAFTAGVNAINGALSKYVAASQINAIDQIKSVAHDAKAKVNQQKLPHIAKSIVNEKIRSLQQNANDDVMNSVSFIQLAKVRQHYIEQLKAITSDKQRVIKNLVDFERFIHQMNNVILSTTLSSDQKLQAEREIHRYQDNYLDDFKRSFKRQDLKSVEHQITSSIVNAVAKRYQQIVTDQTLILNPAQVHDLVQQIQLDTKRIAQQPKINVPDAIRQLRLIVQQRKRLAHQDQIDRSISQIKAQIAPLDDVSRADRDYLINQVDYFNKERLQHVTKVSAVKRALTRFFRTQVDFIEKSALHHTFRNLLGQIRNSHLSDLQQKALRQRLIAVNHDSQLNYDNKQLVIKAVNERGLKLDWQRGQAQLSKLIHVIYKKVDTLTKLSLEPKFARINIQLKQKVQNASRLIDLDYHIQSAENQMCQSMYHVSDLANSTNNQTLRRVITSVRKRVNSASLQPNLKCLIKNRLSHSFNYQLLSLMDIHDVKVVKAKLAQLIQDTRTNLKLILKPVKQQSIQQTDALVSAVHYQLMAYSNQNELDELGQLREHAVMQIHHANTLLRTATAEQRGAFKINVFSNRVIDRADTTKVKAHRQIKQLMTAAKCRLGAQATVAVKTRILMLINQATVRINRGLDKQTNTEYLRCRQSINQVLRQRYLQIWSRLVKKVQLEARGLVRVPASAKQRAVKDIDNVSLSTVTALKQGDVAKLSDVIQTNRTQLQAIIIKASCLDPAKQAVRSKLIKLIAQTKRDAKQDQTSKVYKQTLAELNTVKQQIDRKLSLSSSHQIQSIYQTNRKQLIALRLKIVRQAQLQHFSQSFKQAENQLYTLKFLADAEVRKVDGQFNQCYHKTIYDIKHSPDVEFCVHNLKTGEESLNQALDQAQRINVHKQRIVQVIQKKIANARKKVANLTYLQSKDKASSRLLLKQTQQQSIIQVKNATNNKRMMRAEFKGLSTARHVMNEVSSADVLLAAIQSANDRVSHSALDKQQKQATLKQIHQIINNGIKAQITQPKPKTKKPQKAVIQRQSNQSAEHQVPKHRLMIGFINAIHRFFRWLFGKLVQAF